MNNFPFLKSTRFWAVVALSLVMMLHSYGVLPAEVRDLLMTVLGGHVGLRTIDRFAENVGKK
jgi:hypothetical protein